MASASPATSFSTRATGRALEAAPYLRYLDGKYGKAA